MTEPDNLTDRMRLVETSVAVQEQMLAAVHDEMIRAATLAEHMAELSSGAASLAAALVTVHENAERLCSVEGTVETKADADEMKRLAEEGRKSRRRLLIYGLFALGSLVTMFLLLASSAHSACMDRQRSTRVVVEVLESFGSGPSGALVQDGADRIRGTLTTSCDERYPIRMPWI